MVLGYSLALFVHFTTTQRVETFLHCHLRAFEAFGGYPRELLYDNTKTVVLARPDLRADAAGHAPTGTPSFWTSPAMRGLLHGGADPTGRAAKGRLNR